MILSFQRNKFKVLPMVLAAILVSLIFIPVRSCKKDTEEPIYTKLARMSGGVDGSDKEPNEPIDLGGYAGQNISFYLAAGSHVFLSNRGETYQKTFTSDTAINNPYLLYKQFFGDTTKPIPPLQTKIVNHNYSLVGSDTLFNLLWLQINSPSDITPRQTNTIKEWIQKNLKQDTTNQ